MFAKHKLQPGFLIAPLVILTLVVAGCGTAGTPPGSTVTLPGTTVTLPGGTTTLPAVTVTLPGSVTTIPATTITVPPTTAIIPPATFVPQPTTDSRLLFLPGIPATIVTHVGVIEVLKPACLTCHGLGMYHQFPLPLEWNGSDFGSQLHGYTYAVIPGTIQDHSGRTPDVCLTCHALAG